MAEQDAWLDSRLGTRIRVFLAINQTSSSGHDSLVGHSGLLDGVEDSGLIIDGKWFNRVQIAYIEDAPESTEPQVARVVQRRRGP